MKTIIFVSIILIAFIFYCYSILMQIMLVNYVSHTHLVSHAIHDTFYIFYTFYSIYFKAGPVMPELLGHLFLARLMHKMAFTFNLLVWFGYICRNYAQQNRNQSQMKTIRSQIISGQPVTRKSDGWSVKGAFLRKKYFLKCVYFYFIRRLWVGLEFL